jgi:hypothetical protein
MSYQPKPEIEQKAISYLIGKSNIKPIELVSVGIHRNTAPKVCIYLHSIGRLLRDGRTYTWNPIGTVVPGPMSPVFLGYVEDIMEYLDGEIARRGAFNRSLSNTYINGGENSCYNNRQWADTLIKARKRLRNCLTVQNWELLFDILREIALEVPGFMGVIYSRSEYAQDMLTAERRMAYAAKKPRTSKDDAFHAERQAKVDAKQRAAREASKAADRLLQAQAEALLAQMGALADQSNLVVAMTVLRDMGTDKAKRFSPAIVPATQPVQLESGPPIVTDYVDDYEEFYQNHQAVTA